MRTVHEQLESWQVSWREGIAPQLTDAELACLKAGLESNDERIFQGATCEPCPVRCYYDRPVTCGCAVGFAAWQAGLVTVGEVVERFEEVMRAADHAIGVERGTAYFLNWFDDRSRGHVFPALLREVNREVRRRGQLVAV